MRKSLGWKSRGLGSSEAFTSGMGEGGLASRSFCLVSSDEHFCSPVEGPLRRVQTTQNHLRERCSASSVRMCSICSTHCAWDNQDFSGLIQGKHVWWNKTNLLAPKDQFRTLVIYQNVQQTRESLNSLPFSHLFSRLVLSLSSVYSTLRDASKVHSLHKWNGKGKPVGTG